MNRVALAAAAFLAAVAGGTMVNPATAATRASTVSVQLMAMMVMPSPGTVRSGKVTFVVKNVGKAKHDFVVLKTTTAPGSLMLMGSKAMESGPVARVAAFGPGQSRRLTVTLKAGKYVLLCNLAGHYAAAMRVGFRVR